MGWFLIEKINLNLKEGEESVPTFKETVESEEEIMYKYKQYLS